MTKLDEPVQSAGAEVWLAGATGLVGRAVLDLLVERPEVRRVTAIVRRPLGSRAGAPKLRELVIDFDRLEAALVGQPATHVFCCLGTTIAAAGNQAAFRRVDHDYPLALGRAARAAGAGRFAVITALGANPRSLVFYNRVKGDVEAGLAALAFPRLDIFRPSLLLGERAHPRRGERVAAALAAPFQLLLSGPLRRYRPILAADVARAMVQVALDDPGQAQPVHVHPSDDIAARARTP